MPQFLPTTKVVGFLAENIMKKNLTFAVDVDEVLRSLLPSMVNLYNREFPDANIKYEDVTDFVVENSFPLIEERTEHKASYWFFQLHGEELFCGSDMCPGALGAFNKLKEYGKVIIVTYQKSDANKRCTLEWLSKHGFEADGVCFLKDKTLLHADYIIDDNLYNFRGTNCTHGVVITAPYNKDANLSEVLNGTYQMDGLEPVENAMTDLMRFRSLSHFVSWLDCLIN